MASGAYKENYGAIDWSDMPTRSRREHITARHARADLPTPMIVHGFSEPVQSMADGKYYTTKRALEASYRASGNPQGKEYECIGDDPMPEFKRPKADKASRKVAIEKAIADVEAGRGPEVLTTDTYKL